MKSGGRRPLRVWIWPRETVVVIVCVLCVLVAVRVGKGETALEQTPPLEAAFAYLAAPGGSSSELQATLERIARHFDKPPVNAKVDPVWGLIPGLNGVKLDVGATLQGAKSSPADPPLLFSQIKPAVLLDDFVAQPIYRGNSAKRAMALTFNVAWGTEYVPQILTILKHDHIQATFFLAGTWAKANPAMAREISRAGMEIGNHAYTHPDMSRLSRDRMIAQIEKANEAILRATGVRPTLFAPPSGDFNPLVLRVAAGLRMKTTLWTLDTIDWRKPPAQVILKRILPRRAPGAIVLMHPTAPTVAALPSMIEGLARDGYQLLTVSALLDSTRSTPPTLSAALRQMGAQSGS